MSKKQPTVSTAEQGDQSIASVYDFLYQDARRIGSFLAQFDPSGHLQQVTQTESRSGQATVGATKEGGFDYIATAKGGMSKATTEEEKREMARVYDPLWANALTLLDYLDERKMLKREMHDAGIGQIVLVTGTLEILDLRIVKEAWNVPSLVNRFGVGTLVGTTPAQIEENKLAVDLVKLFPHMIQARIFGPESDFSASWMTLDESGLVMSTGDIMMKYGHRLAGEWNVVGIKDAMPDAGPLPDAKLQEALQKGWDEAAQERYSTNLALFAELLSPIARKMMGRPAVYYGVTPLMIFRKISG